MPSRTIVSFIEEAGKGQVFYAGFITDKYLDDTKALIDLNGLIDDELKKKIATKLGYNGTVTFTVEELTELRSALFSVYIFYNAGRESGVQRPRTAQTRDMSRYANEATEAEKAGRATAFRIGNGAAARRDSDATKLPHVAGMVYSTVAGGDPEDVDALPPTNQSARYEFASHKAAVRACQYTRILGHGTMGLASDVIELHRSANLRYYELSDKDQRTVKTIPMPKIFADAMKDHHGHFTEGNDLLSEAETNALQELLHNQDLTHAEAVTNYTKLPLPVIAALLAWYEVAFQLFEQNHYCKLDKISTLSSNERKDHIANAIMTVDPLTPVFKSALLHNMGSLSSAVNQLAGLETCRGLKRESQMGVASIQNFQEGSTYRAYIKENRPAIVATTQPVPVQEAVVRASDDAICNWCGGKGHMKDACGYAALDIPNALSKAIEAQAPKETIEKRLKAYMNDPKVKERLAEIDHLKCLKHDPTGKLVAGWKMPARLPARR